MIRTKSEQKSDGINKVNKQYFQKWSNFKTSVEIKNVSNLCVRHFWTRHICWWHQDVAAQPRVQLCCTTHFKSSNIVDTALDIFNGSCSFAARLATQRHNIDLLVCIKNAENRYERCYPCVRLCMLKIDIVFWNRYKSEQKVIRTKSEQKKWTKLQSEQKIFSKVIKFQKVDIIWNKNCLKFVFSTFWTRHICWWHQDVPL